MHDGVCSFQVPPLEVWQILEPDPDRECPGLHEKEAIVFT